MKLNSQSLTAFGRTNRAVSNFDANSMRNALIFSPSFDGHRQVYVFVMALIMEEMGYRVVVGGNMQENLGNSFYIRQLQKSKNVSFIDTFSYDGGGLNISLADFLALQTNLKVDLTVFADADNHMSILTSQVFGKNKRLQGKVVGIFMRPFYFYTERSLIANLRFVKHFWTRWNHDERMFYSFFLKRFRLLDVSLSIDENFADSHPKFTWLPDVFQQFAEEIIKPENLSPQYHLTGQLQAFQMQNQNRFHLLYFGTAQFRRGYDLLLKLALETGATFIHCGLRDPKARFDFDVQNLISTLQSENRYFETGVYVEDPSCIEFFFKSVSHLILPYREFYGSSGVMLQALRYGIPVLAPDRGIIGHRIKKYRLGRAYPEDRESLINEFEKFKKIDPLLFKDSIEVYMKQQSTERLKSVLTKSFTFGDKNRRKLK